MTHKRETEKSKIAKRTASRRHFIQTVAAFGLGIPSILEASGSESVSKDANKQPSQSSVTKPEGSTNKGNRKGSPKHPIRIGGPIFTKEPDPEKWMSIARENQYRAVYAPGHLSLDNLQEVHAWRDAAKKNDIIFAEVGCWCNPMDPDPKKQKANMERLIKSLAIAEELDARCAVDIAGSINRYSWFGPAKENCSESFFEKAVENARTIIDAVKPKRSKFAYEAMGWTIPDSPDSYLRLYKAIDRQGFGVHLDICNMINSPKKYWNNTDLINESFDKLGQWIVSCHAKDLRWEIEANIHFVECVIGKGIIDYGTYLRRLSTLPNDVPLMTEHMKNQVEYEQCRDQLFKVCAEVNVQH